MKLPRFSFRRPAPRAAVPWRFLYPLVLLGLIAVTVGVANSGRDFALKIKEGKSVTPETDPTKPNFVAQVNPTVVRSLIEVNGQRQLVGVTVISLAADARGGWLLQLPNETKTLAEQSLGVTWNQGVETSEAEAAARVNDAVARMLDVGLPASPVVVTLDQLAAVMRTAMPFTFRLDDKVQRLSADGRQLTTAFNAGPYTVKKESEVIDLFELITPGESPQRRLSRQVLLWKTWIDAAAASKAAWPTDTDKALVPLLDALVAGPVVYNAVPIADEVPVPGVLIQVVNLPRLRALALEMVPLPVAIEAGQRLRTAVYNGTADRNLALTVAPQLVAAGAQIDRIGNAGSFDVAVSEVRYFDASRRAQAEKLARAVGIVRVEFEDRENVFDLTITLGADFR